LSQKAEPVSLAVGKYRIPHNRAFFCDYHAIFNFPGWENGKLLRSNLLVRLLFACDACKQEQHADESSACIGRGYASTTTRHALARELWKKAATRKGF
jgi:hypothetical protein